MTKLELLKKSGSLRNPDNSGTDNRGLTVLSKGIHVVHLQAFPRLFVNSYLFGPIIGNLSVSSKMSTEVVEFSS